MKDKTLFRNQVEPVEYYDERFIPKEDDPSDIKEEEKIENQPEDSKKLDQKDK